MPYERLRQRASVQPCILKDVVERHNIFQERDRIAEIYRFVVLGFVISTQPTKLLSLNSAKVS